MIPSLANNPIAASMPESRYLDAGGIRTHYVELGKGTPTILIHGGGAGADCWGNWRTCMPLLAKNVRAIGVDLVGFGRSDKPDPKTFTYSQDARDQQLAAFIEALDAGPVNLVGNGVVALLTHPDQEGGAATDRTTTATQQPAPPRAPRRGQTCPTPTSPSSAT